ncbi:acetylglutamate kinase [Rhodopirellula maiorica SM1]|uniref:Acetylglutamate kinase n=1 Tax=Rhodopirellula maiorica SM1 TaxID=1265738 RepID=M5RU27_9BACT|nr:acetylglutamate kinase [Rhodopirellula maiorica SM1]
MAASKLIGFSVCGKATKISPNSNPTDKKRAEVPDSIKNVDHIGDFTLDEAISKANTLIEAMGWIRQFRGKTTVIKLGGSILDDPQELMHILLDVIFMESVGMKPVLVHGGGKAINRELAESGIAPNFVRGRRVTDAATLAAVEKVLAGELNVSLTQEIERLGGRAMNLSFKTTNVLFGKKLVDQPDEDLGFVGEVTRVDRNVIEGLSYTDQVPVIPSMCEGDDGQHYNVNADTAAMAVAQALGADKLVFLSDVNGVRRDKDDPETIIHSLSSAEARELIQTGVINSGMIPKVEACLETLGRGVKKVHIIDGRLRHSLLLEIFTTKGVGTEIHP